MDEKTKRDLVLFLNKQYEQFKDEVGFLKESVDSRNDDVFTKMDQVYKEVLAMRQEQSVHQQTHDDLDAFISQIQSIPAIAHQIKKK